MKVWMVAVVAFLFAALSMLLLAFWNGDGSTWVYLFGALLNASAAALVVVNKRRGP